MDSNFQFPDIVEGSFSAAHSEESVAEPKLCRLAPGAKRIRTIGPAAIAMMVSLGLSSPALFSKRPTIRVRLAPQQNVAYRRGAEDFIEMSPYTSGAMAKRGRAGAW